MRLDIDGLEVQSFPTDDGMAGIEGVTNFSCNLTDDDYTCMYNYCGSRPPGLSCDVPNSCQNYC